MRKYLRLLRISYQEEGKTTSRNALFQCRRAVVPFKNAPVTKMILLMTLIKEVSLVHSQPNHNRARVIQDTTLVALPIFNCNDNRRESRYLENLTDPVELPKFSNVVSILIFISYERFSQSVSLSFRILHVCQGLILQQESKIFRL
jgi:hypothetical protein